MSRRKLSEKIATRRVQYIDKTAVGRTLVKAELMSSGNWRVSFTYPAVGPDSLTEDFDIKHDAVLNSVQKLDQFIAENWEEFNARVVALRKVRYAQRASRFKESDHGKTTAE